VSSSCGIFYCNVAVVFFLFFKRNCFLTFCFAKPAIKHIQINGPKGLDADIGSLKRFKTSSMWLAKKFLFQSGPAPLLVLFRRVLPQ
jgi:hypothetical protein